MRNHSFLGKHDSVLVFYTAGGTRRYGANYESPHNSLARSSSRHGTRSAVYRSGRFLGPRCRAISFGFHCYKYTSNDQLYPRTHNGHLVRCMLDAPHGQRGPLRSLDAKRAGCKSAEKDAPSPTQHAPHDWMDCPIREVSGQGRPLFYVQRYLFGRAPTVKCMPCLSPAKVLQPCCAQSELGKPSL